MCQDNSSHKINATIRSSFRSTAMDESSIFSNMSVSSLTSLLSMESMNIPSYSSECLPKYSTSNEKLPSYIPAVESFGLVLHKLEFISPYKLNTKQVWQPVLIEINSTQLIIYKLRLLNHLRNLIISLFKYANKVEMEITMKEKLENYKTAKDLSLLRKYYDLIKDNNLLFEPINNKVQFKRLLQKYSGKIHNIYTLNHLKVGKAPTITQQQDKLFSNIKYKNTLRLRIELHQILLQFWSFNSLISWFWNLNVGKDLSGDFETMPYSKTLTNSNGVVSDRRDSSITESAMMIDNFAIYIKLNNDETLGLNTLPVLKSTDKWHHTMVSNFKNYSPTGDDDNLFISYGKLDYKQNLKGGICRYFVITQEGLVSLKGM